MPEGRFSSMDENLSRLLRSSASSALAAVVSAKVITTPSMTSSSVR